MIRRLVLLAVLGACAGALNVAPAPAASTDPVIADCNAHGKLTHTYTVAQLQHALATLPADIKEYTNCYDVITRTLDSVLAAHHLKAPDSSGGGGSFLPTPLIVVLVLLVLGAAVLGMLSLRGRDTDDRPGSGGGPPDEPPTQALS